MHHNIRQFVAKGNPHLSPSPKLRRRGAEDIKRKNKARVTIKRLRVCAVPLCCRNLDCNARYRSYIKELILKNLREMRSPEMPLVAIAQSNCLPHFVYVEVTRTGKQDCWLGQCWC